MKRDFELIRTLMLKLQDQPDGQWLILVEPLPDYAFTAVLEHTRLLIEAGYVQGRVAAGPVGLGFAQLERLTWAGHEFLAAAAEPVRWKKAVEYVGAKAGEVSLETLLDFLKSKAAAALGFG